MTYYEFKKEEVDAAVEGQRSGRRLTSVPSRVENKEAFNMLMVRQSTSARLYQSKTLLASC